MNQLYALALVWRGYRGTPMVEEIVVGFDEGELQERAKEWVGDPCDPEYTDHYYCLMTPTLAPTILNAVNGLRVLASILQW